MKSHLLRIHTHTKSMKIKNRNLWSFYDSSWRVTWSHVGAEKFESKSLFMLPRQYYLFFPCIPPWFLEKILNKKWSRFMPPLQQNQIKPLEFTLWYQTTYVYVRTTNWSPVSPLSRKKINFSSCLYVRKSNGWFSILINILNKNKRVP